MSMFDNLGTDETIQEEKDSLGGGGFAPLPSGLYDMKIKYAYLSESQGGASAMNVTLVSGDGKEVTDQQWMTSGKEKGCKNYYMRKDKNGQETGEKAYLPGFSAVNALCLLTAGKPVAELCKTTIEEKTINLYSYDAQAEVPTKVQMVMGLVGQEVTVGLLHQIVDKNKKNEATGKYEPTGETREVNTVDKYFRQRDGMTVAEIKAKATEAAFKKAWSDKWTGVTDNQAKGTKTAGTKGAPAAAGNQAPKENIFA